jgi:hypothetical protein
MVDRPVVDRRQVADPNNPRPGLMTSADKAKLDRIGSVVTSFIAANQAVAAGVDVFLGLLALTPGTWFIRGALVFQMGAGAGTVDARIVVSGTGAAVGGTDTLSQDPAYHGTLHPFAVVTLAANTSYHIGARGNAAWTAKWSASILGNGTETGLIGVRIA